MKLHHPILIYILTFLVLSITLQLLGVINFGSFEIVSYVLIFTGLGLFFNSFGKRNSALLFTGSFIFLAGIAFFLINNFEFRNYKQIILPALTLNIGISFLMLFLDNFSEKIYFWISLIFIGMGIAAVYFMGSFSLSAFLNSLIKITISYWSIFLIAIGIFFILIRSEKK